MPDQSSVWDQLVDAYPNQLSVVVATAGQTLQDVSKGLVQVFSGNGSEVAEMIDRRAAESARAIDAAALKFVDRFPNKAGVAGATLGATLAQGALQFGRGLADTARLGSGVATGTVRGVAEDGLRLFTVLSPALKPLQLARLRNLSKAVVDPGPQLGICLPVSVTKAFRQAGDRRVFGLLSDMVDGALTHPAARQSLDQGRAIVEMTGDLRRLGARFEIGQISASLSKLVDAVKRRPNGVTVFTAHWKQVNPATGLTESVGHAMCAFIDGVGRFRIGDRSQAVVSSLDELADLYEGYKGIGKAEIGGHLLFVPEASYLTTLGNAPGVGVALSAAAVGTRKSR